MSSRLQDVIQRGTRASQPLATAVSAGTLYYVTDEGVTERSDGTNWQSFSDTGVVASIIVSAGGASGSRNSLVFSNSNGVSFGLNGSTITASHNGLTSQSNQVVSAANGSYAFQTLSFSNANGVSFATSAGSAIVGSVVAGLTNINASAGTTSNNLSNLVFSNSNNVSFGLDGSTITATVTVATSLTNINISAGTTSNNLSALVFSNANGVTFGLDGSTITASATGGGAGGGGTFNYFQNIPYVNVLQSTIWTSRYWVVPFQLAAALTGDYFRYPINALISNRTFGATSNNTSWTASQVFTFVNEIFTRGTGASSDSLFSASQFSTGLTFQTSISGGAAGSNYSVTFNGSFPVSNTSSTFSTSYACTSASYVLNHFSLSSVISQTRWLDVPFASGISASAYWLGFGLSSTSGNNGATGLSTTNLIMQLAGVTQENNQVAALGQTSSGPKQFGGGFFTNGNQLSNLTGIDVSNLTAGNSAFVVPFMVI